MIGGYGGGPMIDITSLVARRGDVAWVDLGHRVVVMRLRDLSSPPVVLADSAAVLWRSLSGGCTVGELAALVATHFGMETMDVVSDVVTWASDSEAMGLLETSSPT
jgi:hypothetical protein